jgi:hypothetical protein
MKEWMNCRIWCAIGWQQTFHFVMWHDLVVGGSAWWHDFRGCHIQTAPTLKRSVLLCVPMHSCKDHAIRCNHHPRFVESLSAPKTFEAHVWVGLLKLSWNTYLHTGLASICKYIYNHLHTCKHCHTVHLRSFYNILSHRSLWFSLWIDSLLNVEISKCWYAVAFKFKWWLV